MYHIAHSEWSHLMWQSTEVSPAKLIIFSSYYKTTASYPHNIIFISPHFTFQYSLPTGCLQIALSPSFNFKPAASRKYAAQHLCNLFCECPVSWVSIRKSAEKRKKNMHACKSLVVTESYCLVHSFKDLNKESANFCKLDIFRPFWIVRCNSTSTAVSKWTETNRTLLNEHFPLTYRPDTCVWVWLKPQPKSFWSGKWLYNN